jgi:hypothetical protein
MGCGCGDTLDCPAVQMLRTHQIPSGAGVARVAQLTGLEGFRVAEAVSGKEFE